MRRRDPRLVRRDVGVGVGARNEGEDKLEDEDEDEFQQRTVSLPSYVKVIVAYPAKLAFEKHGVNRGLSSTLFRTALLCSARCLPPAFEWKRSVKSTKFATACYILSFVSYHGPDMIATQTIARWVNVNASRVRQIVARLVRAGLLASTRGGEGGVVLGRHASTISLLDIFDAVAEHEVELFSADNPFSAWQDRCRVHSVLTTMQGELRAISAPGWPRPTSAHSMPVPQQPRWQPAEPAPQTRQLRPSASARPMPSPSRIEAGLV